MVSDIQALKATTDESKSAIASLLEIMEQLRDPENGCPWDLEQTFETIAPYTIEEAYEVADAIAEKDMDELKSELGDLLLQVVFHARMAEEIGVFDFNDVAQGIVDKMIRRHPHVFANHNLRDSEAVRIEWEAVKAAERARKAKKANNAHNSTLDGVARTLPALLRAIKLQKRAARVGFDWDDVGPVMDKVDEELEELKKEVENQNVSKAFEELGDVFFALTNLARHLGHDPEAALKKTNEKFERRFQYMEKKFLEQGTSIDSVDLETMERYWNMSKLEEY